MKPEDVLKKWEEAIANHLETQEIDLGIYTISWDGASFTISSLLGSYDGMILTDGQTGDVSIGAFSKI